MANYRSWPSGAGGSLIGTAFAASNQSQPSSVASRPSAIRGDRQLCGIQLSIPSFVSPNPSSFRPIRKAFWVDFFLKYFVVQQ